LPPPLGPSRAINSPSFTEKLTLLNNVLTEYKPPRVHGVSHRASGVAVETYTECEKK
jgi:hypothetical protein